SLAKVGVRECVMGRRVLRALPNLLLKLADHPIDIFLHIHRGAEMYPGAAPAMYPQCAAAHDEHHEQQNARPSKWLIVLRRGTSNQSAEDQSADQASRKTRDQIYGGIGPAPIQRFAQRSQVP